ncbi:MAG: hypothetical protein OEV42_12855 [Deltaproteobacteria bacterium]|nr:hypothetical protein [Deltaproteobacteria bacterium]
MKIIKLIFLGIIFLTIFSGCHHTGRYQLIHVQNKDTYQLFKMDKKTGEVWALDGKNWTKIEHNK